MSEWQVVRSVGWSDSWRGRHCRAGSERLHWSIGNTAWRYLLRLPSADTGIPAAHILTALNVKAQAHYIADRQRVLVRTFAKKVEMHLLGIRLLRLKHIFTLFLGITCRLCHTRYFRKGHYDFSFDFHYCYCL